ncbi:MAG: neuromedin U [Thermoanaerobaculia bacterium]
MEEAPDQADLAKQVQNPLANLVSLPLQFNFNDGVGDFDRRQFNLNVQPVVPFPGEKWNIISRTIIPVNSVPVGDTDSVFGIGDTSLSLFWSPAKASSLTWGVGPAISLPTASNPEVLGSGKWSLGPTAVLFYGVGNWTMGLVASNVWSVAGDSDRDNVNFFFGQYFVNYNLGKGWAVGTAPIVTANWEAESGNQWTVPWGLQASKVTHFGSQPVNLLLGYYENTDHPEGGAESQVRFQVNFMFPQKPK